MQPLTQEQLKLAYDEPNPERCKAVAWHAQWLQERLLQQQRENKDLVERIAEQHQTILRQGRELRQQRNLALARSRRN